VVHDGLKGNPEIDYQQGMVLEAYWDQFFDRESGVFFYQYIVGTSCADKNNFDLNQTHPDVSIYIPKSDDSTCIHNKTTLLCCLCH
jgi:hypothetical protein